MWEQVKWAMVETADVCGSVRVGERTQRLWWNDEVKAAVRWKEAAWKLLAANGEEAKERPMEGYRVEGRKVKRCIDLNKIKVNEQFGRKMNKNVNGNRNFSRRI